MFAKLKTGLLVLIGAFLGLVGGILIPKRFLNKLMARIAVGAATKGVVALRQRIEAGANPRQAADKATGTARSATGAGRSATSSTRSAAGAARRTAGKAGTSRTGSGGSGSGSSGSGSSRQRRSRTR